MIAALVVFALTYVLMLSFQNIRPWVALGSAAVMTVMGYMGLFEMDIVSGLKAVDYNVLIMIASTMGTVSLFIESRMPGRLAEMLMTRVPNVKWAVVALALFAGIISAFVDNVATVLMVVPVALAISKKLNFSPVAMIIAIAVSSNLQGAATLVGDTTSILLGGFAGMNFMDFFWMDSKPGIFWGVELGAVVSALVLLWLFRDMREPVSSQVETEVEDYFPSILMVGTVVLLIAASFIPEPEGGLLLGLYNMRSGLVCLALFLIGLVRACLREKSANPFKRVMAEMDYQTLLLLFGLFIVIEGIRSAGGIDLIAQLFYKFGGNDPFLLYTAIVVVSVILSAFIDNIPYVATMLPVIQSLAMMMNGGAGADPNVFYFGLLTGATLGGNLTPVGASANITAIGILRKNGETVTTKDFLRVGVPFTISAVVCGYIFIWLFWGM